MLQQRYDRSVEEKWQKLWEEREAHRFDENDKVRPLYVIDTPPPFTSGELHMGHVLSYSFIDFAARYKRMRGFNVFYPQGWDTQGFPTEVRVEKKFGRLPPAQFREKCVEWTHEMIAKMRLQMEQMGFSPDWGHQYRTMDPDYHMKVQLSLLKMHKEKLVYRGKYPVYWCPKCVSAIAKAELDDEEKDGTIYDIKFAGPDGEDLVIATTRPELMPACVAVLYNPADERYLHLEGKRAKTALGKEVPILADKEVDKEFGSGLVMVCTFGDKMDVVWMHRHKLPLCEAVDQHGRMKNAGALDGLKVKEAKKKALELMEGRVAGSSRLRQTVKVHDRCNTPVELIPSHQWFADIRTTGKLVRAMAEKIRWAPDFGVSYLIDWVEGAEWDWVISRQRVFGTPLPFYICECGEASPADESELPFYPEKARGRKCGCGREMAPEASICDCWVDSSITPLVIAGWPDEKRMERFYPSSLRPQGVEIVRTWAFYTIYRSGVALTGLPPFQTILLNGNVLAPDGKKMSKSLGNIVSPSELLRDYPADAIRQWAALSGAMAKDRPFSYEDMKHAKSFLSKIWNAARFVEGCGEPKAAECAPLMVDRWIIGRLNATIKECTGHMENFEYHHAMSRMQAFFWHDFCDNYIEYVKHRIYGDGPTRDAALRTLSTVLREFLKLLAPVAPHISEEIHSGIFKTSVHGEMWPEHGELHEEDVRKVAVLKDVVSQIRQHKSRSKMPQNAELERVRLSLPDGIDAELVEELKQISKVREVTIVKGEFLVTVE